MESNRMQTFVEAKWFNSFVIFLILTNTVLLGCLTFNLAPRTLFILTLLDHVILWIFVAEIGLKLFAYKSVFFHDGWNRFDFIIIGISVFTAFSSISVIRAFRVFKLLRLVRIFPELRRMIESTSRSLRSIAAISALLSIVVYVFAVMSVMLFGEVEGVGETYFGDLGKAIFSLFQVMTLDSWAEGMVRDLIAAEGLWVGLFFGAFILATTFTFLNMFIAVFTNAIASVDIDDGDNIGFSRIINELRMEIANLKDSLLAHHLGEEEE